SLPFSDVVDQVLALVVRWSRLQRARSDRRTRRAVVGVKGFEVELTAGLCRYPEDVLFLSVLTVEVDADDLLGDVPGRVDEHEVVVVRVVGHGLDRRRCRLRTRAPRLLATESSDDRDEQDGADEVSGVP